MADVFSFLYFCEIENAIRPITMSALNTLWVAEILICSDTSRQAEEENQNTFFRKWKMNTWCSHNIPIQWCRTVLSIFWKKKICENIISHSLCFTFQLSRVLLMMINFISSDFSFFKYIFNDIHFSLLMENMEFPLHAIHFTVLLYFN